MPYSSGTYSLPSGNPVVTGTTISSSTTNTTNSDIATALSTCILKDGTQTITANLPMASHKLTGLSAGTTAGDSVEYGGSPSFTNLAYTGTLTGSTGILNIGSGQVYKDASGNVGIGTSSPAVKLDVAGAGEIRSTDGTTQTFIQSSSGSGGYIGTRSNDKLFFRTNNSDKMIIDASGNVGIGTSSPSAKLTIYGATENQIRITDDPAYYYAIGRSSTQGYLTFYGSQAAATGYIFTGAAGERMRIDSSGNLLVGTTGNGYSSKFKVLSTNTTGHCNVFINQGVGDVGVAGIYVGKYDNNTTTSQIFIRFSVNADNTGSGQIVANGAGAAAFGVFSDRRLKENITDLPNQLDNILALKPSEFDYIAGGHQIGFIAQEMQEIYPDAVGEGEDGMLTVTGWSKTEARLVKAIQELKAIIDAQQEQINSLLGK